MSGRVTLRLVAESVAAGAVALAVMVGAVAQFGPSRRAAVEAVLFAGAAGVLAFAGAMALLRWRELLGRRGQQPL
jgi:hypothetical protein